jgi:hypothetical protein
MSLNGELSSVLSALNNSYFNDNGRKNAIILCNINGEMKDVTGALYDIMHEKLNDI